MALKKVLKHSPWVALTSDRASPHPSLSGPAPACTPSYTRNCLEISKNDCNQVKLYQKKSTVKKKMTSDTQDIVKKKSTSVAFRQIRGTRGRGAARMEKKKLLYYYCISRKSPGCYSAESVPAQLWRSAVTVSANTRVDLRTTLVATSSATTLRRRPLPRRRQHAPDVKQRSEAPTPSHRGRCAPQALPPNYPSTAETARLASSLGLLWGRDSSRHKVVLGAAVEHGVPVRVGFRLVLPVREEGIVRIVWCLRPET